MIWKRVMVAPLPVYSRQLPFCSSSRPGESGSAAQASPDEYFKAIIAPIAVPLPWRGVRVFARASQMRKSRLLTTVQVFPTRQTVQLRNGVPYRDSGKLEDIEYSASSLRKVCPV